MKKLWRIFAVAALTGVLLRLFTYEFFLRDDPTEGIALRLIPAFVHRQVLQAGDVVWVRNENRVPFREAYGLLSGLGAPALAIAAVALRALTGARR